MNLIEFDNKTRRQFDDETRIVFDALCDRFGAVQFQRPANIKSDWFVQVMRRPDDELPSGVYGSTALDAAVKLARALKVWGTA